MGLISRVSSRTYRIMANSIFEETWANFLAGKYTSVEQSKKKEFDRQTSGDSAIDSFENCSSTSSLQDFDHGRGWTRFSPVKNVEKRETEETRKLYNFRQT